MAPDVSVDECARLARVAIQGLGAVGTHAARVLAEQGARLVAASDTRATVRNDRGPDVGQLIALRHQRRPVSDAPDAETLPRDAVLDVECDIWIPAARPDVVREDNVPDFVANAGGVICAAMEYRRHRGRAQRLSRPADPAEAGGRRLGGRSRPRCHEHPAIHGDVTVRFGDRVTLPFSAAAGAAEP